MRTTGTIATVQRPQGVAEFGLFAVLSNGEAKLVEIFWLSR